MLGTVVGVGSLAYHRELMAIASAGISRTRVVASVLGLAAILAVLGVLFGELVAAPLTYRARTERSAALSDGRTFTAAGGRLPLRAW